MSRTPSPPAHDMTSRAFHGSVRIEAADSQPVVINNASGRPIVVTIDSSQPANSSQTRQQRHQGDERTPQPSGPPHIVPPPPVPRLASPVPEPEYPESSSTESPIRLSSPGTESSSVTRATGAHPSRPPSTVVRPPRNRESSGSSFGNPLPAPTQPPDIVIPRPLPPSPDYEAIIQHLRRSESPVSPVAAQPAPRPSSFDNSYETLRFERPRTPESPVIVQPVSRPLSPAAIQPLSRPQSPEYPPRTRRPRERSTSPDVVQQPIPRRPSPKRAPRTRRHSGSGTPAVVQPVLRPVFPDRSEARRTRPSRSPSPDSDSRMRRRRSRRSSITDTPVDLPRPQRLRSPDYSYTRRPRRHSFSEPHIVTPRPIEYSYGNSPRVPTPPVAIEQPPWPSGYPYRVPSVPTPPHRRPSVSVHPTVVQRPIIPPRLQSPIIPDLTSTNRRHTIPIIPRIHHSSPPRSPPSIIVPPPVIPQAPPVIIVQENRRSSVNSDEGSTGPSRQQAPHIVPNTLRQEMQTPPYVPVNPFRPSVSSQPPSQPKPVSYPDEYATPYPDPYLVYSYAGPTKRRSLRQLLFFFLTDTIPRQIYLHILLRLPSFYFTRVTHIFQEAELTMHEIEKAAIVELSKGGDPLAFQPDWDNATPGRNLKVTWENFIDGLLREWKTANIVSVLLLSGILTILQIEGAAADPLTRHGALYSLICALMSLIFGCLCIVRFGNMKKPHKAAVWAAEGQQEYTAIWWNAWVMLAMPAIWLGWSIILYIFCIMCFVWRTGTDASPPSPLSSRGILGPRVGISFLLGVGFLYFLLMVNTFVTRYGEAMEQAWRNKLVEWARSRPKTDPYASAPYPPRSTYPYLPGMSYPHPAQSDPRYPSYYPTPPVQPAYPPSQPPYVPPYVPMQPPYASPPHVPPYSPYAPPRPYTPIQPVHRPTSRSRSRSSSRSSRSPSPVPVPPPILLPPSPPLRRSDYASYYPVPPPTVPLPPQPAGVAIPSLPPFKVTDLRFQDKVEYELPFSLVYRGIENEKWTQFISDLTSAWNSLTPLYLLPLDSPRYVQRPQDMAGEVIESWNTKYFYRRGLRALLCQEYLVDFPFSPVFAVYVIDWVSMDGNLVDVRSRFAHMPGVTLIKVYELRDPSFGSTSRKGVRVSVEIDLSDPVLLPSPSRYPATVVPLPPIPIIPPSQPIIPSQAYAAPLPVIPTMANVPPPPTLYPIVPGSYSSHRVSQPSVYYTVPAPSSSGTHGTLYTAAESPVYVPPVISQPVGTTFVPILSTITSRTERSLSRSVSRGRSRSRSQNRVTRGRSRGRTVSHGSRSRTISRSRTESRTRSHSRRRSRTRSFSRGRSISPRRSASARSERKDTADSRTRSPRHTGSRGSPSFDPRKMVRHNSKTKDQGHVQHTRSLSPASRRSRSRSRFRSARVGPDIEPIPQPTSSTAAQPQAQSSRRRDTFAELGLDLHVALPAQPLTVDTPEPSGQALRDTNIEHPPRHHRSRDNTRSPSHRHSGSSRRHYHQISYAAVVPPPYVPPYQPISYWYGHPPMQVEPMRTPAYGSPNQNPAIIVSRRQDRYHDSTRRSRSGRHEHRESRSRRRYY